MDYSPLPEGLRAGVQRWVEEGIQPGSFLSAVIANNLRESVVCADPDNRRRLAQIVAWFLYDCPAYAWGSPQKARKWAAQFQREFIFEKVTD